MPNLHERLTEAQLREKYDSAEIRARIADVLDLRTFLQECVIRSNYKIPDRLNAALAFTPYGTWLVNKSGSLRSGGAKDAKDRDIPKVARLVCLLELYHRDFLVDIEKLDIDELAASISDELLAGNILLPFIHGPGLYEKAARLFPDLQSWLNKTDTLTLLEDQPIGVSRWAPGSAGRTDCYALRVRVTSVPRYEWHYSTVTICRAESFTQRISALMLPHESTIFVQTSRS